MGALALLCLVIMTSRLVSCDQEHVAIVTEDEAPSTTPQEIKRVVEEEAMEDEFHRVFTRASSKSKWGGGALSKKDQKAILQAHNDHRKKVAPDSSDMAEMLWSSKLADQAQTWSDGCVYEHPKKTEHPDYNGIGQNLYIKWLDVGGKNPPEPANPVDLWYGEVKDFHYEHNSCNAGAVCGHYTQVVWAQTTKVGCGMKFCPMARSSSSTYENAWIVTCNYSPAGNMVGTVPYKQGEQCSACEKGFCRNGLCSKCRDGDKGCECNLKCQNCGTLDANKCKCACSDGFYGPSCENPCEDTDSNCGANPGWPSFWCDHETYTFVREKCPAMCKVCKKGSGKPSC